MDEENMQQVEMDPTNITQFAELADRITQALYIIQNKGKVPYAAYQGAKNFCISTLLSYRDGIIAMIKSVGGEEKEEENAETEEPKEADGDAAEL